MGISLSLEVQQVREGFPVFEPLYIPVEWMKYCEVCDVEQIFVAHSRCAAGLVASCSKCGDERVVPYTRTNDVIGWEAYT